MNLEEKIKRCLDEIKFSEHDWCYLFAWLMVYVIMRCVFNIDSTLCYALVFYTVGEITQTFHLSEKYKLKMFEDEEEEE